MKHINSNSDFISYDDESDDEVDSNYIPIVKNLDTGEEIHADAYLKQPSATIPPVALSADPGFGSGSGSAHNINSNNLTHWSPISGRYRKVGVVNDTMEREQGTVMWQGNFDSSSYSSSSDSGVVRNLDTGEIMSAESYLNQPSTTIPPDFL